MTIYKKLCLAISLVCLLGFATVSFAHPPKDVNLTWNPDGNLTVAVTHSVNDPQKHYVNKVIVYVNDKVAAQKEYTSQQSADGLTDSFSLGTLPSGTKINVEVSCIIMGSATGSIVTP